MRRLRAGLVTPLPGGLGPPSAPTTRGRLHWLDAARTKAGESLPDRGPSRAPSAPGSYGPGDRKAAVERREAPALPTMERGKTEDWCAAWRSTPSIFRGVRRRPRATGGKTAYPGPQRIRAMTLGLSRRSAAKAGCLKIKSESGASYRRRCRRAE